MSSSFDQIWMFGKRAIFAWQLPENIVQPGWFPTQRSGARFWRQEFKQAEGLTDEIGDLLHPG